MSMQPSQLRTIVPIAILALVLGAAIGYFAGQQSVDAPYESARTQPANDTRSAASPTPNTKADASPKPAADASGDATPAPPPPEPAKPETPPPPATDAVADPVEALRGLFSNVLQGLPEVERPVGTGTIQGRVRFEGSNEPAAGFLVEAFGHIPNDTTKSSPANASAPKAMPFGEGDRAETAINALKTARTNYAYYHHTRTDADGRFSFKGLPDAVYNVFPRETGYYTRQDYPDDSSNAVRAYRLKPDAEVNFFVYKSWRVSFDIRLADGTPVTKGYLDARRYPANMTLEQAKSDTGAAMGFTGSNWDAASPAHMDFTAGCYMVSATSRDTGAFAGTGMAIFQVGDDLPTVVTITLPSVLGMRVTVQDESEAEERDYLLVRALPWEDDIPPTIHQAWSYRRPGSSEREQYGQFHPGVSQLSGAIHPLVAGRHVVVAARNQKILAYQFVDVGDTPSDVTLVIPPPPRDSYIVVWLKDHRGDLVSAKNPSFSVEYTEPRASLRSGMGSKLRKDGAYLLDVDQDIFSPRRTKADAWTLSTEIPEFGFKKVPFQPGPAMEVTIQFEEPATVEITIVGLSVHPAKDRLSIRRIGANDSRMSYREDGEVTSIGSSEGPSETKTINRLQPGKHQFALVILHGSYGAIEINRAEFTLAPGPNQFSMTIPTLYPVTFLVPQLDAASDVSINLTEYRLDGRTIKPREFTYAKFNTDSKRQFKADYLPAGDYKVGYYNHKDGTHVEDFTFSLPGPSFVTVTPSRR